MSKCAKGQQSNCCICLKEDSVTIRATRGSNNNKNNWIRCDCCKQWFHSTCGGYNISQYNKITKEQIWLKCIVCCIQQVLSSDSEDSTSSCSDLVITAARSRIEKAAVSKTSTTKASKRRSLTESKPVSGDLSLSAGTSQSLLNFSQNITGQKDKEEGACISKPVGGDLSLSAGTSQSLLNVSQNITGQKVKEEGVCISRNIHSESDISANSSDRKEFTINTATSFDSILVRQYQQSCRICSY